MIRALLSRVIRGDATSAQARDTGMAMVLVLLLFWAFRRSDSYVVAAIIVHVVNMVAPKIFRPVAVVWFGASHLLGTIASKVILTIIFFAVVTPIGLWRRMIGADSLQLKAFKAGKGSVMKERNHKFIGKDLEQPY